MPDLLHLEGEDVIITMERDGDGEVINFQAKISSLKGTGGERPVDEVHLTGGYTVTFPQTRKRFIITMTGITADTKFDFMHLGSTESGAKISALEAKEIRSDADSEKRWRIICWFCPKSSHKSLQSEDTDLDEQTHKIVVPPTTGWIYRWIFVDARITSMKTDFVANNMLKFNMEFTLSALDEDGYPNIIREYTSAQSTTALTALVSTAHRGTISYNTTTPAWTQGAYPYRNS
jgi:hypothetical protein